MKWIFKILLNNLKTQGIKMIVEILIQALREFERAQSIGALDTAKNRETEDLQNDLINFKKKL
jgi:hypothetical protein